MYVKKYRSETTSSSCHMKNYVASYGITISSISEEDVEEIMKAVTPILEREKEKDLVAEKEMIKQWDNDSRTALIKNLKRTCKAATKI